MWSGRRLFYMFVEGDSAEGARLRVINRSLKGESAGDLQGRAPHGNQSRCAHSELYTATATS